MKFDVSVKFYVSGYMFELTLLTQAIVMVMNVYRLYCAVVIARYHLVLAVVFSVAHLSTY